MFDVGFLLNRKMKKTLEFAFYSHLEIFKTDLLALVNSDCLTEDTFITAKRKYTQSVLDYMMNSIENVGASSHITAWVCQIRIRIVAGCFDDLFLIMVGSISI